MAVYTFNFNGGGFNQVEASSKREALKEINKKFSINIIHLVNRSSIRRINKDQEKDYWKIFSIFD